MIQKIDIESFIIRRFSVILGVNTISLKTSIPMRKSSNIFSEITKFFKKDDADIAVFSLSKKFEGLKLSEKELFRLLECRQAD